MEADEIKAVYATVEGRVQGVGFRFFVQNVADRLHLTGWVRNKGDDRVEVYAEGQAEKLNELLDTLRRGPSSAMVTNVILQWTSPGFKYARFSILPSEY